MIESSQKAKIQQSLIFKGITSRLSFANKTDKNLDAEILSPSIFSIKLKTLKLCSNKKSILTGNAA